MSDHIDALSNLISKLQAQRETKTAFTQAALEAAMSEVSKKTTEGTQTEQPAPKQ